jgi:hypothetical protein
MRHAMISLLAGLLLLPTLSTADEKKLDEAFDPASPAGQLEAIKKEAKKAIEEFVQAREGNTLKERQELGDRGKELDDRAKKRFHACSRRALELAQKHPKDPVALDALSNVILLPRYPDRPEIETAYDLLRKNYVTSDSNSLVRAIEMAFHIFAETSTKPEQFLRAVVEKNPHPKIQAYTCFYLVRLLKKQASWAEQLRDPARAKRLEERLNADVVKHLKVSDPNKLLKEMEELVERVVSNKYSDLKWVPGLDSTLGEKAKSELFALRYLSIGKTAPEIEGKDIDGKRFKLSDYRGKVVVLSFWGHW